MMDALTKCNEIQPVLERKWEIIWRHAFLCGAREIAKKRQYLWWEEMGDHDWGVARLHAGNAVWRLQEIESVSGRWSHTQFLEAIGG